MIIIGIIVALVIILAWSLCVMAARADDFTGHR
jgi:hypothetical protein